MPTSHDQAGAAADAAPDPILTTDTQGTVLYANPSARRLFDDDRVKGKSIFELVTVDDPDAVVQRLTLGPQRVLASVGDDLLDGLGFEVELSIAPTVFDDAERWVVVLHPLPRHGLSVRELLRRATHDDLTALSNRSSLLEHMDATFHDARTASAPHALFMLDLDRFKHINDSWGHDAGDAVLTEVAGRLLEIFRPGDVVARLGGAEFAAWCHDLDEADAAGLADRLATVFERPVLVGDLEIQISGSIGATTSKFAGSARELLRQADAAMYRAKASSSRGHVIFDEEMHEELQERRTREQELRVAITSRQFVLHYQPVVDLLTHRVVGVEALARWDHPRLGRLAPGEFLPLVKSALL
ncbi:MAG: diguanylate cyclase domain-containing protein, partial [Acidimicrobiales bacterium]